MQSLYTGYFTIHLVNTIPMQTNYSCYSVIHSYFLIIHSYYSNYLNYYGYVAMQMDRYNDYKKTYEPCKSEPVITTSQSQPQHTTCLLKILNNFTASFTAPNQICLASALHNEAQQ